jgi:hypothetical protein
MCYLPAQKESDMSEIHDHREIELLEAQLRECRAENAKLRAALENIVNVKPYYGAEADEMLSIARTALGGDND